MNNQLPKLINIVKDNKVVFSHYANGTLNYNVTVEGQKYAFPISFEESKGAMFLSEDKASFFTRWIRKAIENEEFWPVK
jgi:hypothetical protein